MLYERGHAITVISPSTAIEGEGWLMVDKALASRSEAIGAIGCTDTDFDFFMSHAKAEERNGRLWFPDYSLGKICLFCLMQKTKALRAA